MPVGQGDQCCGMVLEHRFKVIPLQMQIAQHCRATGQQTQEPFQQNAFQMRALKPTVDVITTCSIVEPCQDLGLQLTRLLDGRHQRRPCGKFLQWLTDKRHVKNERA